MPTSPNTLTSAGLRLLGMGILSKSRNRGVRNGRTVRPLSAAKPGNYVLSGNITRAYDQQLTPEEISTLTNALAEEQIRAIQISAGVDLLNP